MRLPFLGQLQISTEDYIDAQTWVKTFGKLPLLKWVCVRDHAPHSFLEALVYKTKAAGKSKTAYHNVSFPKLRYIHLECTNFNDTYLDFIFYKLLDCLMERCERNAEVQALRLNDCYYLTSDDVETLKEIVVDVIWDGIVMEPLMTTMTFQVPRRAHWSQQLIHRRPAQFGLPAQMSTSLPILFHPQKTLSLPQRQQEAFSPLILFRRLAQEHQYLLQQPFFCLIHPPLTTILKVMVMVLNLRTHLMLQLLMPYPVVVRTIYQCEDLQWFLNPDGPFTDADFDWVPDEWFSGL